jgi:NAD(P) transhydrogenase subunit alpha
MTIGILGELELPIVSMVPDTAGRLKKAGHRVWIEQGAGAAAGFPDRLYAEVAEVKTRAELLSESEVLLSVQVPAAADLAQIRPDALLVTNTELFAHADALKVFEGFSFAVLSMDEIPRTSLAQSMDVLSSMASLSGYRAVLEASILFTRYFPMMITAAGSIKPAKVLILGAGVAGLQAIATAKRLGAQVEAFDVRSAVKEEVQSLGARFVEVAGAKEDGGAGGYAVEQSEDYLARQKEEVQRRAVQSNIIIATAQIRGKRAPLLITEETIQAMRPGSVVVDLAASTGGNCAFTQDGKCIEVNGVHILGNSRLAYSMRQDASLLYGNNVYHFLTHYLKQAEQNTSMQDEICRAVRVYPKSES